MPNHKDMISTEEARIMLLEQKNDDFHQALVRIEKKLDYLDEKIDRLDKKFESKIDQLDKKFEAKIEQLDRKFEIKIDLQNNKIDSHFRWTIGLIFGLYATAFATLIGAVGKAYHWF